MCWPELQDQNPTDSQDDCPIPTESTRLNDFKRNPQQFIELGLRRD